MNVIINKLKKYRVTGGLGRLFKYPKTVEVYATDTDDAHWSAMGQIRTLITEQDFKGNEKAPILNKVINTDTIEEI